MSVEVVERIATSQFVWAILCIALATGIYFFFRAHINALATQNEEREKLLFSLYEQQKIESKAREDRLMTHLEKTTETLGAINTNLTDLQKEVKDGFADVWTHLNRKGV